MSGMDKFGSVVDRRGLGSKFLSSLRIKNQLLSLEERLQCVMVPPVS